MSLTIIAALRYIFFLSVSLFFILGFSSLFLSFDMCAKYSREEVVVSIVVFVIWKIVAMTKKREDAQWQKKARVNAFAFSSPLFFFSVYLATAMSSACLSFHYFFPFFSLLRSLRALECVRVNTQKRSIFISTKLSCSMTKEHIYCVPIIHAYSIEDLCRWPLEHTNRWMLSTDPVWI